MEARMFLCLHVKNLHESTKTCLHLELTFTPHYIITDKGLLTYLGVYLLTDHCPAYYVIEKLLTGFSWGIKLLRRVKFKHPRMMCVCFL